jgi:hypothetical protein
MGSEGERRGSKAAPVSSAGGRYAIRVEGHLGDPWSEWLGG